MIAIDFSLNSTGICIYKNLHYTFHSVYNGVPPKATRNLESINWLQFKRAVPSADYSKGQVDKIQAARLQANIIIELLKGQVGLTGTPVALEGFSYASRGASFIDLICFNQTLRLALLDERCQLHFFTPSEVKKEACKGNASKEDMFNAFKRESLAGNTFFEEVKELDLVKPIDDLVDSYFLLKLLKKKLHLA